MVGLITGLLNVIVTVPVTPPAKTVLIESIPSAALVKGKAVLAVVALKAVPVISFSTTDPVHVLAAPLKVTVVNTPSVVLVAVTGTVAVLAAALIAHKPVFTGVSRPFQAAKLRFSVSTSAVFCSKTQLPPKSAAPVLSVDAAISAPVALAK